MTLYPVYSKKEMIDLEVLTMKKKNLNQRDLIDIAGRKLFESIMDHQLISKENQTLIIHGKGNNGEDALKIGKLLESSDFQINYLSFEEMTSMTLDQISEKLHHTDIIMDGIYGIGFHLPLKEKDKKIIERVNQSNKKIISIDIPSGIHADHGLKDGVAIKASITLVCHAYKRGNLLNDAKDHHGKIILVDMGFEKVDSHHQLIFYHQSDFLLPNRAHQSHKYHYGHVLVLGGSEGMLGAPVLSSHAAFRSGAGLVTWAVHRKYQSIHTHILPEVMKVFYEHEDDVIKLLDKKDAIVIGPGMGKRQDISVETLIKIINNKKPVIIDADGITLLSKLIQSQIDLSHVVITPHLKELERLIAMPKTDISLNPIQAMDSLNHTQLTVLLKGPCTLIKHRDEYYYLPYGNPGLAKAGFGDVLSGIIGSYMMKYDIKEAVIKSMMLFDYAASQCYNRFGEHAMMPSDLLDSIAEALNKAHS
jgi:ADP-dependent NAD(P)H-hydrate dehydratase / NAD(P)H-hydrate epimerase